MHGVSSWSPRIYPVICYHRLQWMIQLTVSPSLLHVRGPQNSRLKVERFVCFCLFYFSFCTTFGMFGFWSGICPEKITRLLTFTTLLLFLARCHILPIFDIHKVCLGNVCFSIEIGHVRINIDPDPKPGELEEVPNGVMVLQQIVPQSDLRPLWPADKIVWTRCFN